MKMSDRLLFTQDLVFLRWTRRGSQPVYARFYLQTTVRRRSARMGLTRHQKGPGWEREWAWTTFQTSVAPVRPPAGNGSEYSGFEALPWFASNVLHACKCGVRGIAHLFSKMAQDDGGGGSARRDRTLAKRPTIQEESDPPHGQSDSQMLYLKSPSPDPPTQSPEMHSIRNLRQEFRMIWKFL